MSKMSELAIDVEQIDLDKPEYQHFISTFNSVRWDYQMQSYGIWKENSDKVDWMNGVARRNPEYNALFTRLWQDRQARLRK